MSKHCKVCGRTVLGNACTYCEYPQINTLDETVSELEKKLIDDFRRKKVESVTDFSINAYTYKWDSLSSNLVCERKNLKIADGNECLGKIKWSNASFGQTLSTSDEQQEYPLTITYKVDGKTKEAKIKIKKIKCNDFWKFGVKINKDFTVNFYLGTPDTHTVSSEYPIEL